MALPEGYDHKATSDNFNQTQSAVVYYNKVEALYLVRIEEEGRTIKSLGTLSAAELELVIHAGSDVLHDAKV